MTSSSSNRNGEKILTALLVVAALSPIFAQTRTTTRNTNPGQTVNALSKTSTSVKNNTDRESENSKQKQTGFDPAMYQLSARRTKLIQNAVISHAKTGDLNDPDTTNAILNEIKRQMPVTPVVPLKKTDSVSISMQVRKNVQKGQSASAPKTIEEIAEQKYPLYKIGDTVSFDYYRNMSLVDSEAVNITVDTRDIRLDLGGTEVVGWDNYVGFGDEADFLKIHLADDAALSFNVTAANAAQFVIYSLTEKPGKNGDPTYSLKAVQKTALKPGKGQTEVSVSTKAIALSSGDYYISMLSTNAKTGAQAYYNVSLNTAECSGLPGEILNAQDASALLSNDNDKLNFGSSISSIQNSTAYSMAGVADLTLQQITFEEYNNSTLASL